MTINEYQQLAMRTLNPALDKRDILINGVMGLCGESGEAIDIVKKHLAQGHELNRSALIKELGDVAWYLAETAYALGVSLEEVLCANIEKLKKRYPQGFESDRSIGRTEYEGNNMDYKIVQAVRMDADEIYALYHSLIDMPDGTWDEDYPSREIVEHDLAHHDVLVMRNDEGRIIAAMAISAEDEELADADAAWYADVTRWAALSRLGVDKNMQGKGIAKKMLLAAMALCRERGYEAVRFLVSKSNPAPQRAYAKLDFEICGETELFDHRWLCYQKRL